MALSVIALIDTNILIDFLAGAEAALGHKVGNVVEQAYARSDLFEKRRALTESWARYLDKVPGDVIELRRMA